MKTAQNTRPQCDQTRRSFLKLSGLLGIGAASAALLPVSNAEAVLFGKKDYKVSKTRLTMGTFVAITAIHSSRDEAENVIGMAFEEIDRLSAQLSRYNANSPVAQLNYNGSLPNSSLEVLEIVARSLYYHKETGGAFDITVKPLVELYKDRFAAGEKPSESEISTVLRNVGSEHIRFEGGNISFSRDNMGITLDGIAKGYIVDRVSEFLAKKGITNHLINAGGDIRANGSAAKGKPWTVAIQDPSKRKEYPDVIHMTNGAIATSGNYEVYYDQEKMFHHIVDSRTGHSPELSSSVTVMASSVMDADALSTSVYVMQPKAGIQFVNRQSGCECFVIGRNGSVGKSSGWDMLG